MTDLSPSIVASARIEKVILNVALDDMLSATMAARFAIKEIGFAGGFAIIQRGAETFAIKRNKGGYSVWKQ